MQIFGALSSINVHEYQKVHPVDFELSSKNVSTRGTIVAKRYRIFDLSSLDIY